MLLPTKQEFLVLRNAAEKYEAEQKQRQLIARNREAARALLESISSVSYITRKVNESTE